MADEPGAANSVNRSSRTRKLWPFLVVLLLMGAEGVGVFLLAKAFSPAPTPAFAGESTESAFNGASSEDGAFAEVELAECRPSNRTSGKFVTFHIRVTALVAADELDRAEALVRANRARLEDAVNTVIRRAEMPALNEPDLQTLKRHLKKAFDDVFEDDQLVKKVLIPQFLQSGPGL